MLILHFQFPHALVHALANVIPASLLEEDLVGEAILEVVLEGAVAFVEFPPRFHPAEQPALVALPDEQFGEVVPEVRGGKLPCCGEGIPAGAGHVPASVQHASCADLIRGDPLDVVQPEVGSLLAEDAVDVVVR